MGILEALLTKGAIPNLSDGMWLAPHQRLIDQGQSQWLTGSDEPFLFLEKVASTWHQKISQVFPTPACTTNGMGAASCTFENVGKKNSSTCVRLVLESSSSRMVKLRSSEICSGSLAPGELKAVSQQVVFYDSKNLPTTPLNGCRLYDSDTGDWRQWCALSIETAIKI